MTKPVLFVTGHVPPDRAGAFERLHERTPIELALFGGPHQHGAAPAEPPASVPHRSVAQREVAALIAGGRYRAVIAGTGGRVALPLAWRAARRARLPFVFWAAFWRTPRTPAHLAALPMMRSIYRNAAAVVTYGEHVSAYVRAQGATRVVVAPQSVDNAFWSAPAAPRADPRFCALFVGRPEREKGLAIAIEAWRRSGATGTLTVAGAHPDLPPDVVGIGVLDPPSLRNLYGASDVLLVPSIASRRFIEPWGLVINEAMNQRTAVIASDAVGAAAGGLVRDGRNGLIVRAGDADALALAIGTLAADRARCEALGAAGAADVAAYTHDAWANAFVHALTLPGRSANPAASVEI
jgi:glycosyltransferase involved in cell wall biosynthesis